MKLLMIGLGSMGQYHLKKFTNLGIDIVGGVDPDINQQKKAQQLYNIAWVGDKVEDFKGELDAISIAVPDAFHKSCYLIANKFNKPLFLEKPLACNLPDALDLEKQIGENCLINYSKRNVIALFALKNILNENKLGHIEKVEIEYNQDWLSKESRIEWMENDRYLWRLSPLYSAGGCLADLGSHLLDCLFILFNKVNFQKTVYKKTFKEEIDEDIITYKSKKESQYHLLEKVSEKPLIYVDYKGSFLIDEQIPCTLSCSFISNKYKEAMIIKIIGDKATAYIDTSLDRKNVILQTGDDVQTIMGPPIVPTYTQFKNFVENKVQDELPTIHRAVEIQKILQEVLFCL